MNFNKTKFPSLAEFVIIISMMMALTALSIDAVLPALGLIGKELEIASPNSRQLIISLIFFGLSVGQLFFGPLSDTIGRKRAIYIGYAVFALGAFISLFSRSFPMMLVGRTLQGVGVSAPRAVSLALVRDRYEGRTMARVMSFASTIFILIPMIAPSIGQGVLSVAGWRSIFGMLIVFAFFTLLGFAIRIPETLLPEKRLPFSVKRITNSVLEILKTRAALGYTITIGLVQGAFLGYLNSSQQIFQEQYALGERFPLYFSTIAVSLGLASLLNAQLVMRYGMRALVRWALMLILGLGVVFLFIAIPSGGQPPLWLLMAYLMISFFGVGILFGNVNALAMQPLGHLAGLGAAVVGSISTLVAMLLGMLIGQSYNQTILPLVIGLTILSGLSSLTNRWASAADQGEL